MKRLLTITVRITVETRNRLIALRGKDDGYEDVIKGLLDMLDEPKGGRDA